jgi:DNA-binding transcriptional LysR family regulator
MEVERTGSITQAADNLFIAQPNLSKAIKELENSLGFEVFNRTSKGVIPTKKGLLFIEYARNIISQLDKIEDINNLTNEQINSFGISIPRSCYIADGVVDFISSYELPESIELNINETSSLQTIRDVADKEFSFGVIRYKSENENYFQDYLKEKGMTGELLWEFDRILLMSCTHPLATMSTIGINDLRAYTEITYGDNAVPYVDINKPKPTDALQLSDKRIYLYGRGNKLELLSRIPSTYTFDSPVPNNTLSRYGLVQRKCHINKDRYKDVIVNAKDKIYTALKRN